MSTEAFSQACLDSRGYVVVGTDQNLDIGSLHVIDDQPGTATDAKAVVVSRTDRQDMIDQLKLMGEERLISRINTRYFFRMVAE